MSLRQVHEQDLMPIAKIHKSQFKNHFLGQFSLRLIARYYRSFLGKMIFLVHESPQGVDGFILGGPSRQLSICKSEFLRHNWMLCIWETICRPFLWIDAPRRAWKSITADAPSESKRPDKTSEELTESILSIAVSEKAKGTGAAAILVDAFEKHVGESTIFCRLSVAKDNSRAIRFYQKVGFEVCKDTGDIYELRKRLRSE